MSEMFDMDNMDNYQAVDFGDKYDAGPEEPASEIRKPENINAATAIRESTL